MLDGELQRQKALLAATDASALVAAVGLAWVTHKPFGDFCPLKPGQWTVIAAGAIGLVFIWIMTARAIGLYRPRSGRMDELFAIVKAACVTWLLALVLGFFAHLEASRLTVALAFALSIVLVAAGRALTRRSIRYFYAHPDVTVPLVVVGANPIGRYVRDRIVEELSQYEFLGFIDNDPAARAQCGDELLGGNGTNPRAGRGASQPGSRHRLARLQSGAGQGNHRALRAQSCSLAGHAVVRKTACRLLRIEMVGTIPLIGPRSSNIEGLNWVIKRGFDFVAASALLAVSAPIFFIAGLMVWLFDGRPLLFRQTRIGIHGKQFELLKFRTMTANCAEQAHREYVKGWIKQNGAANGEIQRPERLQARSRPAHHAGRSLAEKAQHRRIAAIDQRAARRDESDRTAPGDALRSGACIRTGIGTGSTRRRESPVCGRSAGAIGCRSTRWCSLTSNTSKTGRFTAIWKS